MILFSSVFIIAKPDKKRHLDLISPSLSAVSWRQVRVWRCYLSDN